MCGETSYLGQTSNPSLRVEQLNVLKINCDDDDGDDDDEQSVHD